jgi:hypothetical protein
MAAVYTTPNDTILNYYYFQMTKHDVTNRLLWRSPTRHEKTLKRKKKARRKENLVGTRSAAKKGKKFAVGATSRSIQGESNRASLDPPFSPHFFYANRDDSISRGERSALASCGRGRSRRAVAIYYVVVVVVKQQAKTRRKGSSKS